MAKMPIAQPAVVLQPAAPAKEDAGLEETAGQIARHVKPQNT